MSKETEIKTKQLVDELKKVCADHGLGNDGNEYKIIIEVFLYKFMNDKFFYEVRKRYPKYKDDCKLGETLKSLNAEEYGKLLRNLPASTAKLTPEQYLSNLHNEQNRGDFAKYFDDTFIAISQNNSAIFSVGTAGGEKIQLFSGIRNYITEEGKRDGFCKAIINKLVDGGNFADVFDETYDFFAVIFEYLIKDYNKDGGGKYAEYYTPRAVAKIMSEILVDGEVSNAECYDPSAGTGSLLMSLAHKIGEDRCTIYSQDVSQKSSTMLRMNLILNDLAHSLPNIVQGNTITTPYHMSKKITFDYIVSNPPFKLDFSDWRDKVDATKQSIKEDGKEGYAARFFAGVPNIPKKKKDSMSIYLLFIQHIMASLKRNGKAAIVVPTGFITAQSGIELKIRKRLIKEKWLKGVVSMPSNIFATTGTNVSVLFIDKSNKDNVVLVDASKLGTTIKDGKNQRTVLSPTEEQKIIDAFKNKTEEDNFSVVLSYDEIKEKNYSFSAGQYFEIKIEYVDISQQEFEDKLLNAQSNLTTFFDKSRQLETDILDSLKSLKFGGNDGN